MSFADPKHTTVVMKPMNNEAPTPTYLAPGTVDGNAGVHVGTMHEGLGGGGKTMS